MIKNNFEIYNFFYLVLPEKCHKLFQKKKIVKILFLVFLSNNNFVSLFKLKISL